MNSSSYSQPSPTDPTLYPPQSWPSTQLLHPNAPFPSPPHTSTDPYPAYFSSYSPDVNGGGRSPSLMLSLNLSSLNVNAPSNSGAHSPHPSTASTISPISPIVPTTPTSAATAFPGTHTPAHHSQFSTPDPWAFDGPASSLYDTSRRPSRSHSSSDASLHGKRSHMDVSTDDFDPLQNPSGAAYDDTDISFANDTPGDGDASSDPNDDLKPLDAASDASGSVFGGISQNSGIGAFGVMGRQPSNNNFVTKLYQMISDPKSAHFISWTELGTSFVVSSVGEFSRSILGSHFKHNNFSSFVRQLNMYGFHKINRTPRAQRTSSDAQTWEFSHHKFLRGRPDLLDEIKRKALEPDPSVRQRVELPAEVAMQLNRMNNDHQQVIKAFHAERAKVERLTAVVKLMYDVMARDASFADRLPVPFPPELSESENPPIFVTSPSDTPFGGSSSGHHHHHNHQSHGGMNGGFPTSFPSHVPSPGGYFSGMNVSPISPSSSPTSPDFPSTYSLSANSSSLHLNLDHSSLTPGGGGGMRYDSSLPPSPEAARSTPDLLGAEGGRTAGAKRQRMDNSASSPSGSGHGGHSNHGSGGGRNGGCADAPSSPLQVPRLVRARSDSAPHGMHIGSSWENGMRPRSGTGLFRGSGGGRRGDDGGSGSGNGAGNAGGGNGGNNGGGSSYFSHSMAGLKPGSGSGGGGGVTVKNEHEPSQ